MFLFSSKQDLATQLSDFWEVQSDYFISIARKTLLWRVGYFTRGNEVTGRQLMAGFHLLISVACGKANTELLLKKKTLNLLGFRFWHWKQYRSFYQSETPHALTVRLAIGARHMQCVVRLRKSDDVSACSLTCQMSMLLPQWLLRLTTFHTV